MRDTRRPEGDSKAGVLTTARRMAGGTWSSVTHLPPFIALLRSEFRKEVASVAGRIQGEMPAWGRSDGRSRRWAGRGQHAAEPWAKGDGRWGREAECRSRRFWKRF